MEASTQIQQTIETESAITIEVSSAERVKVWAQIFANRFVGRYLGKNRFVFAGDELEILRRAGVHYQVL